MKKLFTKYSLGALICIALGAALIVNPHIITDVLNTVIGIVLIAWAAFGVLRFFIGMMSESKEGASVFSLIGSIMLLMAGIYVYRNKSLLETVVMLAIGVYILCTAIPGMVSSLRAKAYGTGSWMIPFVSSAAAAVLGGFIIIAPTFVSGTFMRIVGIVLAAAGLLNIINTAMSEKTMREIKRAEREKAEMARRREAVKSRPEADYNAQVIDIEDYNEE